MTFEEHWQRLLLANPAMREAEKMTISVKSLRAQLERAYRRGFEEGQSYKVEPADDPLGAILEMFGKRRKDQA